jgi:undecaprenyl-diphosphatase
LRRAVIGRRIEQRPACRPAGCSTVTMRGSLATVDGAGLALAGSAVLAVRGLPRWEAAVFRAVNGTPQWVTIACWPPMQAGAGAAPLVVAAALALRSASRSLAPAVALSGSAAWLGAKVAKHLVGRGRPAIHLQDVQVRRGGAGNGRGYVSGHAAVVAALAGALAPSVPAAGRAGLAALVALVGLARIQNGSHLPLDVVGGVGLGLLLGALGPEARAIHIAS